jgi:lysophospholipase L1-like esterase
MHSMKRTSIAAFALAFVPVLLAQSGWVATWSASPSPQLAAQADMQSAKMIFQNQTFRQIVHTSIGGSTARVRISNVFNASPLQVDGVHIALRNGAAANIVAASDQALTFSGRSSVSIPPGTVMISDPIPFAVPADGDLVISFYFSALTWGAGIHYSSLQTNYIGNGDQTQSATFSSTTTVASWAFLAGVDVQVPNGGGTIVTFGDSITDGTNSTAGADHRWPNFLARNLLAAGMTNIAVADAGISGNRILHDGIQPTDVKFGVNGLQRFERDVIAVPGVKWVIILLGINDIGQPGSSSAPVSETVSADDIIAAYKQMTDRAHEMGIKVIGCTITPFAVYTSAGWYTPDKDAERNQVNDWIRNANYFDSYADLDIVLRDPNNGSQLLPIFDSGDHLHPNDAGYQMIGSLFSLTLFQ